MEENKSVSLVLQVIIIKASRSNTKKSGGKGKVVTKGVVWKGKEKK